MQRLLDYHFEKSLSLSLVQGFHKHGQICLFHWILLFVIYCITSFDPKIFKISFEALLNVFTFLVISVAGSSLPLENCRLDKNVCQASSRSHKVSVLI